MKTAIYLRNHMRTPAVFVLTFVLVLTSVLPVFTIPERAVANPSPGGITTETVDGSADAGASTGDPRTDAERAMLARATPAQKRALERLYAQIDAIDRETEIAVEEYNAAKERLDQVTVGVTTAETDYRLLEQAYELQGVKLGDRAVDMYKSGGDGTLNILLDAKSVSDLYSRLQYLSKLSTTDADLMARIRNQRGRLETTMQQIQADQDEAASLEFELRARRIEVTERGEDRQRELMEQNSGLLALLAEGRAEERSRETRLAWEISSGAIKDVKIEPGSPVETAMAYRGIPYLWGGTTKSGFDCSGLMLFVFNQHGVTLPRVSKDQALFGTKVTGTLQPNDLVFFGSPVSHVGLYVGGGYYIHSPRTGDVVKISNLSGRKDLVGARRVNWSPRADAPL